MGDRETARRTGRGLGAPRGSDPDAFGERGRTEEPPGTARTSREPAEGSDVDLPGADKAARTPEDERRKTR